MADNSKIEWTEATWNPITGCDKVSPGCDHCYAETFAERFRGVPGHHFERGFDVQLRPEKLTLPLRWRKPRRIFVNSMSDLFHKDVSDEYIARVFAVMAVANQHTFQLLTKRHARMRALLNDLAWWSDAVGPAAAALDKHDAPTSYRGPGTERWQSGYDVPVLQNVWGGVSVEDQKWADIRIPALLATPLAVRWISAEPLLGPVNLSLAYVPSPSGMADGPRLDWVVVGGESGAGARPMDPDWARTLERQCRAARVPFLFKQWGAHDADGKRVGKGKAGRELDGLTHDGYPGVAA